jgi:hypothetical protein
MIMRRPLDWIVVSISMMVLFANRMLAPKPVELHSPVPEFQTEILSGPAMARTRAQAENPFAWIREDGSLQYLPVAATPRLAGTSARAATPAKAAKPRQSTPSTALYTWSSPTILVDKDAPSFQ